MCFSCNDTDGLDSTQCMWRTFMSWNISDLKWRTERTSSVWSSQMDSFVENNCKFRHRGSITKFLKAGGNLCQRHTHTHTHTRPKTGNKHRLLDRCKEFYSSPLQEQADHVWTLLVYIKQYSISHICLFHRDRNFVAELTSRCADGSEQASPCLVRRCRNTFGLRDETGWCTAPPAVPVTLCAMETDELGPG